MSAPIAEFEANGNSDAEALLSSLGNLAAPERRKHATVLNYWLSIRGSREFPPIRDLDPLQISDAGPNSLLLGIVDEGVDADIRHIGAAIKAGVQSEKVSEAPSPSLLACIAGKLPDVVASKQPFGFEDVFDSADGPTRCWVSLLPFSASGAAVDYVYGFVTLAPAGEAALDETSAEDESEAELAEQPVDAVEDEDAAEEVLKEEAEPALEAAQDAIEDTADSEDEAELVLDDIVEPVAVGEVEDAAHEPAGEPEYEESPAPVPSFSGRLSEKLKAAAGFYGRVADLEFGQWKVESAEEGPDAVPQAVEEIDQEPHAQVADLAADAEPEPDPVADDGEQPEDVMQEPQPQVEQPTEAAPLSEGGLQSLLDSVRAKADEARQAKIRSNIALYEGLGAAYDFALDAEHEPEDYLRLVEAEGLKIQLRLPMAPVVKLAFSGMCDDSTIAQLEAVLAWALKQDLPRGSLAQRIQDEGGIGEILAGLGKKS